MQAQIFYCLERGNCIYSKVTQIIDNWVSDEKMLFKIWFFGGANVTLSNYQAMIQIMRSNIHLAGQGFLN